MSRGVLLFAFNNAEIDYIKIAYINTLMIRHNLRVPVTLVTSAGDHGWARQSIDGFDDVFDRVIEIENTCSKNNTRVYRDTSFTTRELPFFNSNHWMAYKLSPYDETLFIDVDYLIMSEQLSSVWGSNYDFMINRTVTELISDRSLTERMLSSTGIDMYWATCVYFKKSTYAELLFSMVEFIGDNYLYYRELYGIESPMFRNDYAFSIALHTLNGFNTAVPIPELPISSIVKLLDYDDFFAVNGINDLTLLVEKSGYRGEYTAVRVVGLDVHVMNKWSIVRMADKLVEIYS